MKKEKKNKQIGEKQDKLVAKKEKSKNKISNIMKTWLLDGLTTILLVIIIFLIYIFVNLLLEKVVLPEFDLTENKVYSLSQETTKKLENLSEDVAIKLINYDNDETVKNFAEKYTTLNNKIKIEEINDLESRKDLMEKYSLETTSQLIIVASGENETTLSEYDLYTYDYSTYETIDTTEEALTNAIVEVTTKDKPKIYFMSSHVMYDIEKYYATLIQSMKEDANEVETLDILIKGGIPEDCDTLIITTLKEDITELEKNKILEYINRGGKILLLCGPNILEVNLNNFQEVLNQYGITLEKGVIFEGDSSKMLYGYPDFIIEKLNTSSLTEKINMNLSVCLADAASIKLNEENAEKMNIKYEKLSKTSNKAFLRTNLTQSTPSRTSLDSEENEYIVGAMATKNIEENIISKLIIFSNELFVSDMKVDINGYEYSIVDLYNNEDTVLNSIAYLNQREDTITIRKTFDTVPYTATELQNNIIMAIIFILPLIIILVGIIVWQYRRRKR